MKHMKTGTVNELTVFCPYEYYKSCYQWASDRDRTWHPDLKKEAVFSSV